MPRPPKCRRVKCSPQIDYFKPAGVPLRDLTEVYLPVDGYEALRLAEIEGLSHEEAAELMNVSRHTFGRVLSQARRIVAEAVVKGRALSIAGGHYVIAEREGGGSGKCRKAAARAAADGHRFGQTPDGTTDNKELHKMKIAISADGPSMDELVNPRFGRAPGFMVVDLDSMEFEYIDNGVSQAMAQGAGIQAAELVANSGAKVVLTGYVGPKAFQALEAAGVQVGQDLEGITIRQAAEKFVAGEVKVADAPNR